MTKITPDPKETDWMRNVWLIFNDIEADAEKRFAKSWARAEATFKKDEPIIEQDDDMPPVEAYDDLSDQTPF